jgi:LPXTG-motif cell wall-anchored protein
MSFVRVLGALLVAVVAVLVPSSAHAYPPAPEAITIAVTNPAPGEPFQIFVDSAEGPTVTVTITSQTPGIPDNDIEIAGSQSMTKETTGDDVSFTATLYAEGRYDVVATDAEGDRVGETIVVVGDGVPGETGDDVTEAGVGLPDTGSDVTTLVAAGAGALLLLAGVAALVVTRRRDPQAG